MTAIDCTKVISTIVVRIYKIRRPLLLFSIVSIFSLKMYHFVILSNFLFIALCFVAVICTASTSANKSHNNNNQTSEFNETNVVEFAEHQYDRLVASLELGHQYPTHGSPLATAWSLDSHPTRYPIVEIPVVIKPKSQMFEFKRPILT